jgi:hypothetical protein
VHQMPSSIRKDECNSPYLPLTFPLSMTIFRLNLDKQATKTF